MRSRIWSIYIKLILTAYLTCTNAQNIISGGNNSGTFNNYNVIGASGHAQDYTPCQSNPCGLNETCHANTANTYSCTAVCDPSPCASNAICSARGMRGMHAFCTCPTGYIGNALHNCTRAFSSPKLSGKVSSTSQTAKASAVVPAAPPSVAKESSSKPQAAVQTRVLGGRRWRDDSRCGANFKAPNGQVAECDPNSTEPCCSSWGHCGLGADGNGWHYCTCDTCRDFRLSADACVDISPNCALNAFKCYTNSYVQGVCKKTCNLCDPKPATEARNHNARRWRDDLRCGAKKDPQGEFKNFRAPNGQVAECDPDSSKPCCSSWGYCGLDADGSGWQHCTCDTCSDFRRS